jgi:hypothetical protein
MLETIILVAGAVVGFAIGWTLGYRKGTDDDARMREDFLPKPIFKPLTLHGAIRESLTSAECQDYGDQLDGDNC